MQSLDPKELWRTITEEAPPVIGCELAILYIYVENGILALLNPEGDVLEFITLGEAGVVGELFKNSTPKYLSTRTHAVREKQKTGSAAVKRVAIQEVRACRCKPSTTDRLIPSKCDRRDLQGARPHAYGSPIEEQAPCLTPETSSLRLLLCCLPSPMEQDAGV